MNLCDTDVRETMKNCGVNGASGLSLTYGDGQKFSIGFVESFFFFFTRSRAFPHQKHLQMQAQVNMII